MKTLCMILLSMMVVVGMYTGCDPESGSGPIAPEDSTDIPIDTCTARHETYMCRCIDETDDVHFRLLRPNGGEVLRAGTVDTIRFCSEIDDEAYYGNVVFKITADGGKTWSQELMVSPADGPHVLTWTVPSTYTDPQGNLISFVGKDLVMKVSLYDVVGDPNVDFDISDRPFSVE